MPLTWQVLAWTHSARPGHRIPGAGCSQACLCLCSHFRGLKELWLLAPCKLPARLAEEGQHWPR